jgi:O-antigen/teichoic acid export membrane protein
MASMSFSDRLQDSVVQFLRWSEKYTKTDMVYLAQGGFWLTLELVVAAVFSLILAIVFGHYANQSIYGNYKYVLSIAALLSGISLSGMGVAITQAVSKGKEGALKQGVLLNLRWSIPMSLVALCVGVYYYFQGNPFVAISMCIVAAASPFVYSFQLFDNLLIGRREFSRSALYSMLTNLATMIVLVGALFIGGRAIILVIAYFAINIATAAFFYVRTARSTANSEEDPDMLRYGFHLSLMGVIGSVADQIDSITVFALLGPANLAVYTYAIAMPEQIKGVIKNIVPISMPKFAQRSIQEIRGTIWNKVALLGLGLIVIAGLYVIAAPLIFRILFPVYVGSIWYSQIYMVSLTFAFITPLSGIFQAHKKTKELYVLTNVSSIVLIIALPILVHLYGIMGAIGAQLLYRGFTAGLALVLFLRMKD